MATKNLEQLTADLQSLNNKELHNKCLEYGLNVPVVDSSRDVIIRKLLKNMGALPVTSPRAIKKQQNKTNNESLKQQRQTINVMVHVDDDNDVEDNRNKKEQPKTQKSKTPTRTKSPQAHSQRESEVENNNNNNNKNKTPQAASKVPPILKSPSNYSDKQKKNVRIVPMDVDLGENNVDKFHCEVRRSGGSFDDSNYSGARVRETTTCIDDNLNARHSPLSANISTYHSARSMHSTTTIDDDEDYEPSITDYSYNSPKSNVSAVGSLKKNLFDEINANNQQRPRHVSTTTAIDVIDDEDAQDASNFRHLGFRGQPHGTANLNSGYPKIQHSASSLSKTSISTTSYNAECTPETTIAGGNFIGSPVVVAPAQAIFKQPLPPSKSLILNKQQRHYGPEEAKRLYPYLPADLYEPLTPPSTPNASEYSMRSSRASSLAKSGTLTTSYTQERTPTRELNLNDVECDAEGYVGKGSGYDRSTYLSGMLHESVKPCCRLPFEPQTYRNSLDATHQTPINTTTISDDELESEQEIDDEQQEEYIENDADASSEEYEAESSALGRSFSSQNPTSSYGGTQIYERVPQRRSLSNRKRDYQRSTLSRRSINGNDVEASFRHFVATVDQKYHVKQWLCMFGIFVVAVVIYVFFVSEGNEAEISIK